MKTTVFVNMLCAPDGAELAKGAGRLVNSLLVDVEEIISGILESSAATENFQALCCAWCMKQSELLDEIAYDGRNEEAVMVGNLLTEGLAVYAPSVLAMTPAWSRIFANTFSREHRTLQQLFSCVAYRFLSRRMQPQELEAMDAYMKDNGQDNWRYRIPLI